MVETFPVPLRGIGKPDYTREVSSALERRGLRLAYKQTLQIFGRVFSTIPSPYAWVTVPLPPGGTHTGANHFTIMTDATANFPVPIPGVSVGLIGMIIGNVTDGSSGVVIANTVNTVTVTALVGGILNRWTTGDIYNFTAHFIDNMTGQSLPFTVPQGYTLSLIAGGTTSTEDAIVWVYFGTPPGPSFLVLCGGVLSGGNFVYENKVVAITTATIDPTGAAAHALDIQITNRGAGNLEGAVDWTGILEEVGSPSLPTTKTVRCKFCGHEETVPLDTVQWICPKCGKLNMFFNLFSYKRSA